MKLLDKDIENICNDIKDISNLLDGKRVLITGGQGFLGQYICATLNKLNPKEVIVIDNFITVGDKIAPNYNNFKYINTSVEDYILLEDKIDYIIFLAGIASPYYYIKYPLETVNIVSVGLSNYLKLAKQHNAKLLFASSSEIYGSPDTNNIPTKEIYNGNVSTLSERACYDESKRLGETLCRIYSQQKTQTVIVRPFNFFGPLMQPTDYRVLPNFANNILTGKVVELYGDGNQTRTFCYVSDGIAGIFRTLLLGRSGEAYNIGNPNNEISMANLLELCEKVCSAEKIKHPMIYKKITKSPSDYPVNGDPIRRCPDITKAMKELNYQPKISIKNGLSAFLTWADKNYKKTQ